MLRVMVGLLHCAHLIALSILSIWRDEGERERENPPEDPEDGITVTGGGEGDIGRERESIHIPSQQYFH